MDFNLKSHLCFRKTFFLCFFFLLIVFTTTQNTVKSNNKNSNYINQLLRLPLLKHTHPHTHTDRKKKKWKRQYQPPSPRKKHPYNTADGGLHSSSQGIGAVSCCFKDLHPRGCRDSRSISFLCKCNLTKSLLASVSLLKHFPFLIEFFSFLHHSHIVSFLYPLCL